MELYGGDYAGSISITPIGGSNVRVLVGEARLGNLEPASSSFWAWDKFPLWDSDSW